MIIFMCETVDTVIILFIIKQLEKIFVIVLVLSHKGNTYILGFHILVKHGLYIMMSLSIFTF